MSSVKSKCLTESCQIIKTKLFPLLKNPFYVSKIVRSVISSFNCHVSKKIPYWKLSSNHKKKIVSDAERHILYL